MKSPSSIHFLYLYLLLALAEVMHLRDVPACTGTDAKAADWAVGVSYTPMTMVNYHSVLYSCLQPHTSQSGWTPPATPNLWITPTPCGVTAWQVQTAYQLGSIVTYDGAAYECIQAHHSTVNWTPNLTPALWERTEVLAPNWNTTISSCTSTEGDGITTLHTKIVEQSNITGDVITVIIGQIIQPSAILTKGFGGSVSSMVVLVNSDELYTITTSLSRSGAKEGAIHWGSLVHGASRASFSVNDNGTVIGSLDGRAFNPFPHDLNASNVTFSDGGPSPLIVAPAGLNETLSSVGNNILKAFEACASTSPQGSNSSQVMTVERRGHDRAQDQGHFSLTYSAGGCNLCKISAEITAAAAGITCAAATCWWSFGVGCVACLAGAALASASAIDGCEFSGSCCPQVCGSGSFPLNPPPCCFGDEICLDHNGHCCSSSQQACGGKSCCNGDQSCITAGPQQGTCCPIQNICGNSCCPHDTDTCVLNSICCAVEDKCGNKCCNPIDVVDPSLPTFNIQTCANAQLELCCAWGQIEINGVCCYPGQVIQGTICCDPGQINCNGSCCLGTCSPQVQCMYTISDAECNARGYSSGSCANSKRSCLYCTSDGCCVPPPK